jgi:hypothetical protein
MSERCIVAVRFTPAGSLGKVRKAVGGFLRYVQHRDLHPAPAEKTAVSGLLKYVAYRDRASARAELFGPSGTMTSAERKDFAAFVLRSLAESKPQLYRARSGEFVDRRRAVYRLVISPERAYGLDLRQLTFATVAAVESELGGDRLRWMAAIHRNTAHPHVHLVVAGMRETDRGFRRVELTKPRLAAMKAGVAIEIARQRAERRPALTREPSGVAVPRAGDASSLPAVIAPARKPTLSIPSARSRSHPLSHRLLIRRQSTVYVSPALLRVRAAARRYARQMAEEAERESRQRSWEHAA